MRYALPESRLLRALPFLLCATLGVGLFMTRPRTDRTLLEGGIDAQTAGCLSNLNQLSRAYALYAQDFDGKIPMGVDPEDRFNPSIWRDGGAQNYDGAFFDDATRVPFLHEILRPYVKSPGVFHCPADSGWKKSKLTMLASSSLTNIYPSSFARFGTSYYCLTKYGFAQLRADDIEEPGQSLLLFDGDLWHVNNNQDLLNGLFADGHAQNLTLKQFEFYAR